MQNIKILGSGKTEIVENATIKKEENIMMTVTTDKTPSGWLISLCRTCIKRFYSFLSELS